MCTKNCSCGLVCNSDLKKGKRSGEEKGKGREKERDGKPKFP